MPRWRSSSLALIALAIGLAGADAPALSQAPAAEGNRPAAGPPKLTRPGLFFREEWKQTPQGGEHPVTAESIGNPNLELKLYVLTGLGRIRWNTKMSGFHQVRPIVKLPDGAWYVGDRADGSRKDWLVSEISFADVRWVRLDIGRVVTVGPFLDKLDLSKVDEIGFADLMPSSGHGPGGWSDVAQVEVFGKAVPRTAAR